MVKSKSSFKSVLPYALVVFLGYLGFAMPLPILPEMFLDPEVGIFASTMSRFAKTVWLGIVMSAYPLGQFLGAPILGRFSDHIGRKKVILCSLCGSMISYLITAFATELRDVSWIFMGLFLCGLCEGNVAIAQSVVADIAHVQGHGHKAKHLGWLNLFACFAFVIGPILGGQLSDPDLGSLGRFSTPFWVAAGITLLSMGIIWLFSQETKPQSTTQISFSWKAYKQLYQEVRHSVMYRLLLVNFLLAMGYYSYFRFFPVYIEYRFSLDSAMLGYIIAYGSMTFALFSLCFLKKIGAWLSPKHAVGLFASVLACSLILLLWPSSPLALLGTMLPINLALAVIMTYSAMLISEASSAEHQGRAFGLLTSVQVLAEVMTGLIGGVLAGFIVYLPIIFGACFLFLGAGVLLRPSHKEHF